MCNATFANANFEYGPSWAILGPSWGYLGAILGYVGNTMVYLGSILGPSWPFLGLLCLYFAARRSQSRFLKLVFRRREMLVFGILLPRLFPELLVEHPWGHLGPSCSHLGAILGYIGPILGPSWAFLGQSWPSLCKFALSNFA